MQPSAVVVPPRPEAVSALPRADGCSADIVAAKTKSSVTNRTTLGCAVPVILGDVTHACLLCCLRRKGFSVAHGRQPRSVHELCRSTAVMLDLGSRIGEHFVTCNGIVDSSETKGIGQLSQSYVGNDPTLKRIGRAIPRYDR